MRYRILIFFLFSPAFAMDIDTTENIDAIFCAPTLKKLIAIINARPELKTGEFTSQCILDKLKEFEVVKKEIQPVIDQLGIKLDLVHGVDGINTRTPETGTTALSILMFDDPDVEFIEKMLKSSADPNIPDKYGDTCLKYIINSLEHETNRTRREKYEKVIELLVKYGADPEIENIYGITAFENLVKLRVTRGMVEVAELFLNAGININRANSRGNTPLIGAINYYIDRLKKFEEKGIKRRPSMAFIEFLLDHGAQPNVPNKEGIKPLALVIMNGAGHVDSLMTLLLQKGAKLGVASV